MHVRRTRALAAALAGMGALSFVATASASTLVTTTVRASAAKARACTTQAPPGAAVATLRATADRTGLLTARSIGRGDWDIAVYDARSGRLVGAGANRGRTERAQGFVAAGQDLLVQACRFSGGAGRARITLNVIELAQRAPGAREQVVAVHTPTRASKSRLGLLGLDPAEGATRTTVDVVLHDADDAATLREHGFVWTVKVPDLLAMATRNARSDRAYAARTAVTALPSGRDAYRHLADYDAEMKQLAMAHPGLVKLIELPHKSLEGRAILGLEIGRDVNVADGKPVFVQLGVHHAREWPSGEHAIEWAYELINGYGKDERVTRLVDTSHTVVVPIVNPDGFDLTREAPVDLGNPAAAIDLPPDIDNSLPITDPTYTAALLLDQTAGFFAYKRRNCRIKDGETPEQGACGDSANRQLGTDPNRNYGGLWGGPGASLDPTNDTYRGAAPFSEPEVQNVRELVSTRQVTALITNHTFTGLVLRPPGVRNLGPPIDEAAYKALGDAMAAQNGYVSEPGYQLYDTTGTTEDWSYPATGGFGFTFEIGKDEFHPPFSEMVREYTGPTELGGPGGNRAAYLLAQEWAAEAGNHSLLRGRAPAGTTLRLHKSFMTQTSPVIEDAAGKTGAAREFEDTLDSTLDVGSSGTFAWHVNPSTRPAVAKERKTSDVADAATKEVDISSPTPVVPGQPREIPIQVPADAARQLRATTTGVVPVDDIDIYLYEDSVKPENQVSSSAGGSADEVISYDNPVPGKTYILQIVNFAAVGPYDGKISMFAAKPGTEKITPAATEAYTLTCERGGKVLRTQKVQVARGQSLDLGDVCDTGVALGSSKATLSARVSRRGLAAALRRGLRVRVGCAGGPCRSVIARLVVDGKTARRLGLAKSNRTTIVARSATLRELKGARTVTVRFTAKARRALRRTKSVKLSLLVTGKDTGGRGVSRTLGVRLRR